TLDVALETDGTEYRLPHPPLPTWSQYYPGDNVQITVSLHNNSDQELTFRYGWNVYAYENAAGHDAMFLLYNKQAVWGTYFPVPAQWPYTYPWLLLGAGESWERTLSWNLTDNVHGRPIEPGQYELVFAAPIPQECERSDINWSEMSKRITVVPEPGTLSLLAGLAAAGLLRKDL
ncbi:MAG: PEP-CTERM sorting domain-containing protein, partial [Chloroflexi bacterium]|nr:PEP-CTERM sorting domain-containing protein [Chloroflexota bacterium]